MSSENQQLLTACQYKALVYKITIPVTVIINIITNFTLYYQVTQNKLKTFKSY